jgi:transposase
MDISLGSVNGYLAKIRKPFKIPNVYIKQYYEYGKRLEYDFGEVKLDLGEGIKSYHMAVFCAPASNFRWCYLYDNEKQPVFFDSHVRFFEAVGGVWESVFYDNMRNVVTSWGGKNEKKLNEELLKLASYYGFEVRTTNPYAGNEKGSVERSVSVMRNKLFAVNQRFADIETVRKYISTQLKKLNQGSDIECFSLRMVRYAFSMKSTFGKFVFILLDRSETNLL